MTRDEAVRIVSEILAPLGYHDFFEGAVGRRPFVQAGAGREDRALMLGEDPAETILAQHEALSEAMTYHAKAADLPPPDRELCRTPEAFRKQVEAFHARDYTVRAYIDPGISEPLARFVRALEVLLEVPVSVMIFWSAPGAQAPIHDDREDIICIQLMGAKRWFISQEPATLPNPWKAAGETLPQLGQHGQADVGPGDLLYMPRGTPHTVTSLTESIHLSIGFTPVTVRDVMQAMLDHMADMNIPMRAGFAVRADGLSAGLNADGASQAIVGILDKLQACCASPDFVETAMKRRRARMVVDLPALDAEPKTSSGEMGSRLRHVPLVMSETVVTAERIDLSLPGETVLIHAGAEEALAFITATPEFAVKDIPGDLPDDVRDALLNRLIEAGLLEAA